MNLRLDKYGNDFGIVDSLGGAKSATRVRRKKRDLPRRDLPANCRGIRESMDEEAIAELYAGRRYDKPLRPRPAHGNGGGNGGGHGGGARGAHGGGNGIGHSSHGDGNGFGHDNGNDVEAANNGDGEKSALGKLNAANASLTGRMNAAPNSTPGLLHSYASQVNLSITSWTKR